MNDAAKTLGFVFTAIGMLLVSAVTYYGTLPTEADGFGMIGEAFFDDFADANQANSLEVYALDTTSAELKHFLVEEKKGLWTIPSHFNYPAEASDRLAATATSVMGLEREALVGRLKSDHERFGVVDPTDEDTRDPDTAGQRLTINNANGDPIVDLIIGKQAGEVQQEHDQMTFEQNVVKNYYYVRKPGENQTYKVRLNIDLSTRFSDWIHPNLLQVENSELKRLVIDNYQLQQSQASALGAASLVKVQGDQLTFNRESGFGPWELAGVSAAEELDATKLSSIVTALEELEIAGVRPKTMYQDQQLITADLKLNQIEELRGNPQQFQQLVNQLQMELLEYGFNLAPGPEGTNELLLVSSNGELEIGTDKGVVYTLQFGKEISGDEKSIEVGGASSGEDEKSSDETSASDSASKSDEPESTTKNRYLMIRVSLDESLFGNKPVRPIEPQPPVKPEGYTPAVLATDAAVDGAPKPKQIENGTEKSSDKSAVKTEGTQDDAVAAKDERDPKFIEYDQMLIEFEQVKSEYELGLTRYDEELKSWDEEIVEGNKRVKALNERFGKWFYVISGENLDSMSSSRSDLVKLKATSPPAGAAPAGLDFNALPQPPNIDFGSGTEEKPADPKAEDAKSGAVSPDKMKSVDNASPPVAPKGLNKSENEGDKDSTGKKGESDKAEATSETKKDTSKSSENDASKGDASKESGQKSDEAEKNTSGASQEKSGEKAPPKKSDGDSDGNKESDQN